MKVQLPVDFYQHHDVVMLARLLIGKVLVTKSGNKFTSGIISETEAYNGVDDRACHAYAGKRTARTEVMYHSGGVAYVYLCYGIHQLFNIVTGPENDPKAVLIRSIVPVDGIEIIRERRGKKKNLGTGPGVVTQALNIGSDLNGSSLCGGLIWVEERGYKVTENQIDITPRIGIDYAGEDALLPYRFVLRN